ncbi:MAG: hypothetical protein H7A55_11635 [Verrucomicrobiaceae bacterium]|nr:hypothetical protein [Verrucomicrobiaceae bacterium]
MGSSQLHAESITLRVCAENPHYLEWRGKPAVLISSAEHYGAVLNADFDYRKYLATLAADGMNHTRTFSGAAYLEPEGAFHIEGNTLAPAQGRYVCPWGRSTTPGASDGGNLWDLTQWNEAYFERLRDFIATASKCGVVVEFNFFCPFYIDKDSGESKMWPLSPFHPHNNVNASGPDDRTAVYTLERSGPLLAAQERFVRRVVDELKDADNVYYEICNEPYIADCVAPDWQAHISGVIADAQRDHAQPKLISQNIANKMARIVNPDPRVSLFNFHYTYPPVAREENADIPFPLGNNETGFRGNSDEVYRNEAWDWMLAGGALFSHLDYSFTKGHEDGSFSFPPSQPGGGGAEFRRQLAVLASFMQRLDLKKVTVAPELLASQSAKLSVRLLTVKDRQYAAYLHHSAPPLWKKSKELRQGPFVDQLALKIPTGRWKVQWIDPASGNLIQESRLIAQTDLTKLHTPKYQTDLALFVERLAE